LSKATGDARDSLVVPEVVLADIRETPLSVDEVVDAVRHPRAGVWRPAGSTARMRRSVRQVRPLRSSARPP